MTCAREGFDVERVRVGLERDLLGRLDRELGELRPTLRDFEEVRREWLWAHEELPGGAQARAARLADAARAGLGVARFASTKSRARRIT
jgi:hypothetical protein